MMLWRRQDMYMNAVDKTEDVDVFSREDMGHVCLQ